MCAKLNCLRLFAHICCLHFYWYFLLLHKIGCCTSLDSIFRLKQHIHCLLYTLESTSLLGNRMDILDSRQSSQQGKQKVLKPEVTSFLCLLNDC